MTKDRRGDVNRRWIIKVPDFWISPGMESLGNAVAGKSGSRFHIPTSYYDTNPWDGTDSTEDVRHFRYWENPAPWEPGDIGLV